MIMMKFPLSVAFLVSLILADAESIQTITIGGWIPDSPDILIQRYSMLFENYLNDAVGSSLSVQFKLVPAEYTDNTSTETLLRLGQLDFMCKWQ